MDALLTELAPWVGRLCSAIALSRGEDAMQETLILVLRNLPTLRDPGALRAWVRRIAVRQSLRMTGDTRMVSVPEPPDIPVLADLDTAMDVRETLTRLSPSQRAVLVLRDLEDLGSHLPLMESVQLSATLPPRQAPVDDTFRAWADGVFGSTRAALMCRLAGLFTFHDDPGELSAAFVWDRYRRSFLGLDRVR